MIPHCCHWNRLWIQTVYNKSIASEAEQFIVDHFLDHPLCQNRGRGGAIYVSDEMTPVFLYVAYNHDGEIPRYADGVRRVSVSRLSARIVVCGFDST